MSQSSSSRGQSRPRVLVVDDEPNIRAVLCEMLTRDGCRVVEASHGIRALVELTAPQAMLPDLVILDITMPLEDGIQVLKLLRNTLRSSLPVIVLTGSADDEQEDQVRQLGVQAYLRKPIASDALLSEVRRALT